MEEKENIFDYHNAAQKNDIDLKFFKAINKWIIIKFKDYSCLLYTSDAADE